MIAKMFRVTLTIAVASSQVRKASTKWPAMVLVRELRHSPEKVWIFPA